MNTKNSINKENKLLNFFEKKDKTDFSYSRISSHILFKEIFVQVAKDNWNEFIQLSNLPLPWLEEFRLEDSEEKYYNGDILSKTTKIFPDFFHAALIYFPNKYCLHLLDKVVPLLKDERKEKFKKNIEKNLHRVIYKKNIDILDALLSHEIITYSQIVHKIFSKYTDNREYAITVMKNKILRQYLIDNKALFKELKNKTIRTEEIVNEAIQMLEDARTYMPEQVNIITNMYIKCLYEGNNKNPYAGYSYNVGPQNYLESKANSLLVYMLENNYLDVHSLYDKEKKLLSSNEDKLNSVTIQRMFNLSQEFINNIYQKRAEKLEGNLEKHDNSDKGRFKL